MRYDHKGRSTDGFKGFWPGNPPADCPFPRDRQHDRVVFTGRYANYTNADTWYPSWASDGHLYSPWTDGYILNDSPSTYQPFEDAHPHHACNSLFFMGRNPATAQAKIVGDDPMNLTIVDLQPRVDGLPWPDMTDGVAKFHGRYPCGSLVYNGVWYYGTYLLENWPDRHCGGGGGATPGPVARFPLSRDFGKTWTASPCTPAKPLCPGNPRVAPVKFAAPHFVDFGKNMQHSPDGYAYLTAHGSLCPDAWNNWIQGDCIFLARVKPSPETMNDLSAYEFFAGHDEKGEPIYTRYLGRAMPLLEWAGRLGCVTATYNSAL
ncbi:MAG TPA: hypothetical protein PKB10_13170, partial [Tepidisphaeraceae bacterium]|nr:hypothetical protein [Tepidisphaeraceae bacterium]